MTNSLVYNKPELIILGLLIKDLGSDLLWIEAKNKDLNSRHTTKNKSRSPKVDQQLIQAKDITANYLSDLQEIINQGQADPKIFYENYINVETELRKFILLNSESAAYDDQSEYSRKFAINLIQMFYEFRTMLFHKNNNLISSIVGELSRNYNEHGGKEALATYFVFKILDDYYRYAYFELFINNEKTDLWNTKERLTNYIDLVYNFSLNLIDNDFDVLFESFNDIITKIGVDYRIYYLNYGDLKVKSQGDEPPKAKIELSKEAKQKIGEIIGKSLRNE